MSVGYTDATYGFDHETCAVISSIHEQSPDIAMGVDPGGAGDQGMMFGYASNENAELMPTPILLSHRLTQRLAEVRKSGQLDFLRPDGKSQVTVEYDESHRPVRGDAVVVSTQHSGLGDNKKLRAEVLQHVIQHAIPPHMLDADTKYLINPTGRFVVGGPQGDTGLTGRKIIVDSYGGMGRDGGGGVFREEPAKMGRRAGLMGRFVPKKNIAARPGFRAGKPFCYPI